MATVTKITVYLFNLHNCQDKKQQHLLLSRVGRGGEGGGGAVRGGGGWELVGDGFFKLALRDSNPRPQLP